MPREVFIAGQILTAAELNTVSDQTVMVFAGTAARGSAIPTPSEGMVTYLSDSNQVQAYTGSAFTPIGTILQVVSTTKTDTFTTSSATYTAITGLSASITPSSTSSKVLIMVQLSWGGQNNTGAGHFKVTGGNTSAYVGDASGLTVQNVFGGFMEASTNGMLFSSPMTFLDAPATTSATTYQVETRQASTGTVNINRPADTSNTVARGRGVSTITLMEVAG